jgi:hypothetical protein
MCKQLRYSIFLLLLLFLPASFSLSLDPADVATFAKYGRWCGSGHGGYQDCCDGGPCPGCSTNSTGISQECIEQCPPLDLLDAQCVFHDHCARTQTRAIDCSPQGNFCGCDCLLVRRLSLVDCSKSSGLKGPFQCELARKAMTRLFTSATACFSIDPAGNELCNVPGGPRPLSGFCAGNGTMPWDTACIPDQSGPNQYCNPDIDGNPHYLCYNGYVPINGKGCELAR